MLLMHHLQAICSPHTASKAGEKMKAKGALPQKLPRGVRSSPLFPLVAAHCLQKLPWCSLRAAPGAGSQAPALLRLAEMPNCGECRLTRIITRASGRAHPQPAWMLGLDAV